MNSSFSARVEGLPAILLLAGLLLLVGWPNPARSADEVLWDAVLTHLESTHREVHRVREVNAMMSADPVLIESTAPSAHTSAVELDTISIKIPFLSQTRAVVYARYWVRRADGLREAHESYLEFRRARFSEWHYHAPSSSAGFRFATFSLG